MSSEAQRASGTCIGTDGSRYEVAGGSKQVLKYEVGGAVKVIANGIAGNDLVVDHNGNVYVTAPDGTERPGKIWLIRPGGQPVVVDSGLKFVNGLCLTPDQTQLYVAESASHWIWVFSVKPDGTLANKQRFGWLHVPDDKENAWPDGLKCDRNGLHLCGDEYGYPGTGSAGAGECDPADAAGRPAAVESLFWRGGFRCVVCVGGGEGLEAAVEGAGV